MSFDDIPMVMGDFVSPECRDELRNRYKDFYPYSHNVVTTRNGRYVNASWIDSPSRKNRYIATQSPLPNTFSDFWHMVWENRVQTILMLTKFSEGPKLKAHYYWPSIPGESVHFEDNLKVKLLDIMESTCIEQRRFLLTKDGQTHTVYHYHYLGWPDYGVPRDHDDMDTLLSLMENDETPTIVH